MKPHFLFAQSDIAFPKRVLFAEIQLYSMSSFAQFHHGQQTSQLEKTHGFFFCRRQLPNQHSNGYGITTVAACRRLVRRLSDSDRTVAHAPALHVHYLVS
ncbi:hypothetical protein J6590_078907 [Homalodisca vitripennis]|nr:hypothetical protein J6590_078907 [Homalodisca vitripennis]